MGNMGFSEYIFTALIVGVPLALAAGLMVWIVRTLRGLQADVAKLQKSLEQLTRDREVR
jgi:hypothetical protein